MAKKSKSNTLGQAAAGLGALSALALLPGIFDPNWGVTVQGAVAQVYFGLVLAVVLLTAGWLAMHPRDSNAAGGLLLALLAAAVPGALTALGSMQAVNASNLGSFVSSICVLVVLNLAAVAVATMSFSKLEQK